ncbi:Pyridine nucleotide-disulfide oxidoreductase-like protein [Novymonas esmeraldas]|uniref:Pyridine nucleotide-disulfide oxidoreductase-like protein n=1 Tax=Novymonas esmeraldas TaxID=1808958 RepID=A0AAW0EM32_9TRYP
MSSDSALSKDDKRVLVVGAGMVGVSAAWHLQRRGYQVTVIDRKPPGEETSWGNAGLIQRECVRPYPMPQGFLNRIRILFDTQVGIRCDKASLPQNLHAIYLYWRNSSPRLYEESCRAFSSLIVHCTEEHDRMIKASQSEALVRKVGYLKLFRTKPVEEVTPLVEQQRAAGVSVDLVMPADLQRMEPDVKTSAFTCGFHFTDTWQVTDPGALVKAYARSFVSSGGAVVQASVQGITPLEDKTGSGWVVETDKGSYSAPRVVVATGPWSNEVLAPLGYKFPLIPLRGYNTHYQLADGATLNHSILDMESGYVLGPMQAGIRLTTGGEVTSLAAPGNEIQLRKAEAIARTFLPLEKQVGGVWHGHRPLLADMKPVIGESPKHPGLWMCLGHGHQGFTLGPISGRLLGEMMDKESPVVDPSPFSVNRFL